MLLDNDHAPIDLQMATSLSLSLSLFTFQTLPETRRQEPLSCDNPTAQRLVPSFEVEDRKTRGQLLFAAMAVTL